MGNKVGSGIARTARRVPTTQHFIIGIRMGAISRIPGLECFPFARAGRQAQFRQPGGRFVDQRSEEHTSELQSLMRISYAVFCLKKTNKEIKETTEQKKRHRK